jgi:hypothetical protein
MDDISIENTDIVPIVNKSVEWSTEHENILIEWADKAMCYRWLHSKSNMLFSRLNAWYTIPVIVISTLTGTANFAQERVPLEYQNAFAMVVGGFNIMAGIITTIQQFLKITQMNEAHRVSSIAWDKFYRNIKIELAKHPNERIDARQMLKMSKEEFDRLMETSPIIPEQIIGQFKSNFSHSEDFKKIIKPEICDTLIPTNNYRNPWYNDENREKVHNEETRIQLAKEHKQRKIVEHNKKLISDFFLLFNDLHNRDPMESEIIDNLKEKMPIETILELTGEYKTVNTTAASNMV